MALTDGQVHSRLMTSIKKGIRENKGFHGYKVMSGIMRDDLKPPWASILGRQETCLGVGPKREGCHCME